MVIKCKYNSLQAIFIGILNFIYNKITVLYETIRMNADNKRREKKEIKLKYHFY